MITEENMQEAAIWAVATELRSKGKITTEQRQKAISNLFSSIDKINEAQNTLGFADYELTEWDYLEQNCNSIEEWLGK